MAGERRPSFRRDPIGAPFRLGAARRRDPTVRWAALTLLVVACSAAVSVVATMARTGGDGGQIVESPVAVGPWDIEWGGSMTLPAAEQARQMAALRDVTAAASALLGILGLLTVVGLWRQRLRLRRTEDAVHWSVGARRVQAAARLVGEGWRWGALALGASVAVAYGVREVLEATFPGTAELPAHVGGCLIVLTALAAALLRWEAGAGLKAARAGTRRPALLSSPAVVAALGFTVLTGVGLLGRHAPGGETSAPVEGRIVTGLSLSGVPERRRAEGLTTWLTRSDRAFGVASAGAVRGVGRSVDVWVDCGNCYEGGLPLPIRVVRAEVHAVASDTFPHLGLDVVGGRDFDESVDRRVPDVAIVSRAMAVRHFEDGEAVGRVIRVGESGWLTVVGVVSDAHDARDHAEYAVYLPLVGVAPAEVEVIASTGSPVAASLPEGADLGPTRSEDEVFAAHGWFAGLLGVLGATAYVLVVLGVWLAGRSEALAMAFDLSLRRAVGARRRDLHGHFARSSIKRLAIAFGIGGWLSLFLGAGLNGAYGSIPQIDGAVWLGAALPVALAYLVGTWPVFVRASRMPPATGLARGS